MHFVKDILIMLSLLQEFLHKNICLKDSGRCHVEDVSWLLDREHTARSLDWSCLRTRHCGGKKKLHGGGFDWVMERAMGTP